MDRHSVIEVAVLGNILPPEIAAEMSGGSTVYGGWLSSYMESMAAHTSYGFTYFFPQNFDKSTIQGTLKAGIAYCGFYYPSGQVSNFAGIPSGQFYAELVSSFQVLFQENECDVLHVFGTEFPYAAAAIEGFGKDSRVIIHVQGLLSALHHHYLSGVDPAYFGRRYLSNLVRGSLATQRTRLETKSAFERRAFRGAGYVVGRTEWDRAWALLLNREAQYHHCDEVLRPQFYSEDCWAYSRCEKHTVLFTQATSPIKGFHYLVRALQEVRNVYPDVLVYVAGNDVSDASTVKKRLASSAYSHYVRDLIDECGVRDNIAFVGPQSAEEMKRRYLECNVFVSASTIENSPNSVCEAMMLGCPVVASNVGGVSSICNHADDSFMYPSEEWYMLAHYVMRLFDDSSLAERMGQRARNRAMKRHDIDKITATMQSLYEEVAHESLERT